MRGEEVLVAGAATMRQQVGKKTPPPGHTYQYIDLPTDVRSVSEEPRSR